MSAPFSLKPTHRAVTGYYTALRQLANVGAKHEGAVRAAFDSLLETCAGPLKWTLVRSYELRRKDQSSLYPDGALLDQYRLVHGFLEAKDDADDLAQEMRAKLKLGYPANNTLFWQPHRAILVQNGKIALDYYLDTVARQLCEILNCLFAVTPSALAKPSVDVAKCSSKNQFEAL